MIDNDPELHLFINPELVVEFSSYKELLQFISKNAHELTEQYIFISSDRLTSKEQFDIEFNIKSYPLSWRFVSGGARSIVRSIIYYIEGDMKYEA